MVWVERDGLFCSTPNIGVFLLISSLTILQLHALQSPYNLSILCISYLFLLSILCYMRVLLGFIVYVYSIVMVIHLNLIIHSIDVYSLLNDESTPQEKCAL